jgi:DNA primase
VLPEDFTIATVPSRYAEKGDLHARIDDAVFDLGRLLAWADRDERDGHDVPPEHNE